MVKKDHGRGQLHKLTCAKVRELEVPLVNDHPNVDMWCCNCRRGLMLQDVVWTEVLAMLPGLQYYFGLEPRGRSETAAYTCLCSRCSRWFVLDCHERGFELHTLS